MNREKIKFPATEAYYKGLALLGDEVAVYVRIERRRTVAAWEIPSSFRAGLAGIGAVVTPDTKNDGASTWEASESDPRKTRFV